MEFIPRNRLLEFHDDTLEVIRKRYNLDNGRNVQSVNILEEWVKKQAHFTHKEFSRAYYEKTVMACKGSVEKAKSQIDKSCTFRTLLPKFFSVENDARKSISRVTDLVSCVLLPKMTKEYQRVFVLKIYDKPFASSDFLPYFRYNIMLVEYLKAHDYVDGFIAIEDFREANLTEILKKINFIELQQFMTVIVEGFGAKLAGIHMISESKVTEYFVKTVKAFLPPKIANRIYVHKNMEDLYKVLDRKLLPRDMGGNEKPLRELQDDWTEELCSEEQKKYLEVMSKARTDETLRQLDKFNEQCMGLPGSFRTLTVD